LDPSQISADNLNSGKQRPAHCGNKTRERPENKVNKRATGSKDSDTSDTYRGVTEFKKHDKPRIY
jgi:hypothetical protein